MTTTRSRLPGAPAFGARSLLLVAALAIGGATLPARADIVTTWNEKAIELLPKMKKQGPFNLRGLAMMHAAMFDAVNAVERKYSSFRIDLTAPKGASAQAAAAAAARRILLGARAAGKRDDRCSLPCDDCRHSGRRGKRRGTEVGDEVGAKDRAWRAGDRSDQLTDYTPRSGPGLYDATSSTR